MSLLPRSSPSSAESRHWLGHQSKMRIFTVTPTPTGDAGQVGGRSAPFRRFGSDRLGRTTQSAMASFLGLDD